MVVTYTIENKNNSLKATLSNLTVTNDSAKGYFTVETTELNDTVLGVYSAAETTYYIRPTINLIGDVIVTSGTGEYNSPYQVSLP